MTMIVARDAIASRRCSRQRLPPRLCPSRQRLPRLQDAGADEAASTPITECPIYASFQAGFSAQYIADYALFTLPFMKILIIATSLAFRIAPGSHFSIYADTPHYTRITLILRRRHVARHAMIAATRVIYACFTLLWLMARRYA